MLFVAHPRLWLHRRPHRNRYGCADGESSLEWSREVAGNDALRTRCNPVTDVDAPRSTRSEKPVSVLPANGAPLPCQLRSLLCLEQSAASFLRKHHQIRRRLRRPRSLNPGPHGGIVRNTPVLPNRTGRSCCTPGFKSLKWKSVENVESIGVAILVQAG